MTNKDKVKYAVIGTLGVGIVVSTAISNVALVLAKKKDILDECNYIKTAAMTNAYATIGGLTALHAVSEHIDEWL